MAFPVVQATNTSVTSTPGTTHTASLPASISSGDLLIVFIRTSVNTFPSTPTGWTGYVLASTNGYLKMIWKIASGSEGASVAITTSAATNAAMTAYRITGHDSTNPITYNGIASSLDPEEASGQYGEQDYLYIAVGSTRRTDNTLTVPTNYGSQLDAASNAASSDTANVRIATGVRSYTSTYDDPVAFGSTGTTETPHSATIVIRTTKPSTVSITSWAELADIANYKLALDYQLENDLDENSAGYDTYASSSANSGAGWTPLGNWDAYQFDGSFDGQGHTIKGLYINNNTITEVGLFGAINGTNQSILDLGLLDVNISSTSGSGMGALLGSGYMSILIKNCYATGIVDGDTTANYVGGLLGDVSSSAEIHGCRADVEVSGNDYVGGFIGYSYSGHINNCYALGNVTGFDDFIGGFAGIDSSKSTNNYARGNVSGNSYVGGYCGLLDDRPKIYCHAIGTVTGSGHNVGGFAGGGYNDMHYCFSTGNVEGTALLAANEYTIGGFVGWLGSSMDINNCFALGNVYAPNYWGVGGFFGESYNSAETIKKCFCIGEVTGDSAVGGFSGYSDNSDQAIDCFWNTETSGQATSDTGIPATTAEMKTKALYTTITGQATTGPITVTQSGADVTTISGGTGGSGETDQQKGQSFTATGTVIASVQLKFWKWGTPTDNIICTITSSLGGASLGSKAIAATSFSAGALVTFTFDTPINVTNGNTYYIQLSRSGARDTGNACAVYFRYNTNPYAGGSMWRRDNNTWAADGGTSHDFAMVITHDDGVNGLLNSWTIGTGKDLAEIWGINASE